MWYFVKINGQFLISPNFGQFELRPTRECNTYLWSTEQDARSDQRWQHLAQPGDRVEFVRTYQS